MKDDFAKGGLVQKEGLAMLDNVPSGEVIASLPHDIPIPNNLTSLRENLSQDYCPECGFIYSMCDCNTPNGLRRTLKKIQEQNEELIRLQKILIEKLTGIDVNENRE